MFKLFHSRAEKEHPTHLPRREEQVSDINRLAQERLEARRKENLRKEKFLFGAPKPIHMAKPKIFHCAACQ